MLRTAVAAVVLALSLSAGLSYGTEEPNCPSSDQTRGDDPNSLEGVLAMLDRQVAQLNSYHCNLDYLYRQPLLESETRRTGTLSYAKFGERSFLRIDFNTLQYDDEPAQEHTEQFFFDGVWGTYIDYASHSVQRQQIAEPNAPMDAFVLVSRRVPVVGFSKIDELRQQFEVELLAASTAPSMPFYRLHLETRPESPYREEYVTIDVEIDKQRRLPAKIVAVTTEQDVHEIKLMDAAINQPIDRERFTIEVPADFSVERVPLHRTATPQ